MNATDLRLGRALAELYRTGKWSLRAFHRAVYREVKWLRGTAPEVWLSTVMQMAKGDR